MNIEQPLPVRVEGYPEVWLNDTLVNYGYSCTSQKGKIALQSEGSEIEFKRVDLTPITEITQSH